uniref:Uncharacterized protein n=1 Tax=Zea mays TaxID=4577 RepID=A0A804RD29_MAIZE
MISHGQSRKGRARAEMQPHTRHRTPPVSHSRPLYKDAPSRGSVLPPLFTQLCLRVQQANGCRPPAPPAAAPYPPARPLRPALAAAASAHRRAVHLHVRRPPLGLRKALRSRPRQRRHRLQGAAPPVLAAARTQDLRGRGRLRGARGRDPHARRGRAPRRAPPHGDPVGRRRGGARGSGAGAHARGLPRGPASPAGPADGGAPHRRRGAAGAPRARGAPRAPRRAPRPQAVEPARRRRRRGEDRRLRRGQGAAAAAGPLRVVRRHGGVHVPRAVRPGGVLGRLRPLRRRRVEPRGGHPGAVPGPLPSPARGPAPGLGRAHVRHMLRRGAGAACRCVGRVPGLRGAVPREEGLAARVGD